MKKIILILTILGLISVTSVMAKDLKLVEIYHGSNHNGKPYKALIYGIKSEKEPPIRVLKNCIVKGGCVPDEYLINEVNLYFIDQNGNSKDPWGGIDYNNGLFLYFGESYRLFYDACYDNDKNWRGRIVKKIYIDFYDNDLQKIIDKNQEIAKP